MRAASPQPLFGLPANQLLLFRHRGGVPPEKGKSVESFVQYDILQFSRLRFVDDLPRFSKCCKARL